jgi:hypothetical protein
MPLAGRCLNAGTVVLNYRTANVAPTQKDKPCLSSKRRPDFQTHKWSWNEQKFDRGFRQGSKPRTTVLARASSKLLLCPVRVSFVSDGQMTPPPAVLVGQAVTERNVSLRFSGELDNGYCDSLLPIGKKKEFRNFCRSLLFISQL